MIIEICSGDGMTKQEKEAVDEIKTLLDWIYSRELSWAVLILTCFVGLIELLPEVRYYGSSATGMGLTFLLALIALTLVAGCIFSFDRFVRLTNVEGILEGKLSKTMRDTLYSTMGPFHKIVYEMDEDNDHAYLKRWVVPLVSLIFATVWIAIILLKIYLSLAF